MPDILETPLTLITLVLTITVSIAAMGNAKLMDMLAFDVGLVKRKGQLHRMLTVGFVHGGPIHLAFNMLTLFFFGPPIEASLGREAFLLLYFGSMLAGSAWTLLDHFREPGYRSVGASGAISGLLCCIALFQPLSLILVLVVPMPIILYAAAFIGWSIYASKRFEGGGVLGGIDHAGHLGGSLGGIVITCLAWPQAVAMLPMKLQQGIPF